MIAVREIMLAVDVIAQLVRTEWTKQSRGGPGAALRNAAPVGFALPSVHPPLTHVVIMAERDGFEPAESLEYARPDRDNIRLTEAGGRLRVALVPSRMGAPERAFRPNDAWLERGEWLRWQINYRFAFYDSWKYRLDTWNIAYADAESGTFTGTPVRRIDERAQLR